MEFSGISRQLDQLGRLVIPKELCNQLGWKPGTMIAIKVRGEFVSLTEGDGPFSRKMDKYDRVVVPVETKRNLGWKERSFIEFWAEDNSVLLRLDPQSCLLCGQKNPTQLIRNRPICEDCIEEIRTGT